jgi:hypothetical protein
LPLAFLGPGDPLAGPRSGEDRAQPMSFDFVASDSLVVFWKLAGALALRHHDWFSGAVGVYSRRDIANQAPDTRYTLSRARAQGAMGRLQEEYKKGWRCRSDSLLGQRTRARPDPQNITSHPTLKALQTVSQDAKHPLLRINHYPRENRPSKRCREEPTPLVAPRPLIPPHHHHPHSHPPIHPPPNRHTNPPTPKTASDRDQVPVVLLLLRLLPLVGNHPPVPRGQLPARLLGTLLHRPGAQSPC